MTPGPARHPYRLLAPGAGRLVVATPALEDPNFVRAVVLLLDHDEEGTLGLLLNRPTAVTVSTVLPEWGELSSPPEVLFEGGPVSADAALALASVPIEDIEPIGFRRVFADVGMVDLDTPTEVIGPAMRNLRVYAGYAGWGPGQLESEVEEGSWVVTDSRDEDLFASDAGPLWGTVMRRQAGGLAWMSTRPHDPGLN